MRRTKGIQKNCVPREHSPIGRKRAGRTLIPLGVRSHFVERNIGGGTSVRVAGKGGGKSD